jgi:outer membrane receptor protein involved in Fe transport
MAQSVPDRQTTDGQIIVYGRALEQIGEASSGSEGVVGYADFEDRPISRVGELAENVPGLVATQHSGTGKANQYFLRGFNLDHGTDFAGFVDGAPINMRTHGHGQGYFDLNFLIPELIERIEFTKGPYHAELGDFSSAGSASFITKTRLDQPIAELTAGSFGYYRALVAGSGQGAGLDVLAGLEATSSNGPWVLDEDLEKFNGLLKVSAADWSLSLSGYRSKWTSTDQVPLRSINNGLIDRRGFIDPHLGGRASRVSINFNGKSGDTSLSAFAIGSRLRLTSNFTYFLEDPVNGDEFRQVDRRGVFGGSIKHQGAAQIGALPVTWRFGADTRLDRIGLVGLYRSTDGAIRVPIREDRVRELGGGLYGEIEGALTSTLRLIAGLRGDAISYRVRSDLAANSGSGSDAILSPKLALAWKASPSLEVYADYGQGYHSNDVRGATTTVDPASGGPADRVPIFARSRGYEVGARFERAGITASLVAFALDLDSELVFVGDAGTTEPNAASRRYGGEATLFWRPTRSITLDAAAAWTNARFRGVGGQDRIPGAVSNVLSAGVSVEPSPGLTLTARMRHFGSAPLIEDNSVRSDPTSIVNMGGYWTLGRFRIAAELLNAFNSKDADITYFYASRLPGEPAEGIADIHLHAVEPRQLRLSVRLAL